MDEDDNWVSLAVVLRCEAPVAQDVIDLLKMVPGAVLVFHRASPRRLYVTDRDPGGGRR